MTLLLCRYKVYRLPPDRDMTKHRSCAALQLRVFADRLQLHDAGMFFQFAKQEMSGKVGQSRSRLDVPLE
jgi:hypothetical protein